MNSNFFFEIPFVVFEIIFFITAFVVYDIIFFLLWASFLFIPNILGHILITFYYIFFTHTSYNTISEICRYYFIEEDAVFLWIVGSFLITFFLFQIATFSVIFFIYTMKKRVL